MKSTYWVRKALLVLMVQAINWPWSKLLRFNALKLFFLNTARPIEAKLHAKPPWDGGTKVCSNGPGHMTKIAIMPIYMEK